MRRATSPSIRAGVMSVRLSMRALTAVMITFVAIPSFAQDAKVMDLQFKFEQPKSRFVIRLDKGATFQKTVSAEDKQIIIDVQNTKIDESLTRKTDTSQFASSLVLYSARQKDQDSRIVLQMRDAKDVEVSQEGNQLVVLIENTGETLADENVTKVKSGKAEAQGAPESEVGKTTSDTVVGSQSPSPEGSSVRETSKDVAKEGSKDNDSIESFIESQSTKKYVGTKISVQMMNADLQEIFRIIANASEFNILLSDEVKGKMSLDLTDVPWDQVLDIVLKANQLSAERVANILRVLPTTTLQKEKEAEAAAKLAAEAAEPLVSKIFPISYADPADIKRVLDSYLSRDPKNPASARGVVDVDRRSNSLIVRETPSTIEKFKRIIKELDTQTPQILIEGKFLEVSETQSRTVEGQIFGTSRRSNGDTVSFNSQNSRYAAVSNGRTRAVPNDAGGAGSLALTAAAGGIALGFSPKVGLIAGLPDLGAFLAVAEGQTKAKVIASPRVVTQNRQPATLTQGNGFAFATPAGVGGSGGLTTVNANLTLNVEPQVTNEGSINLKINFSQSTPIRAGASTAALVTNTRSVNTNVLVDSGSTLVIGGVYQSSESTSESGIPFLRDIPILGILFGGKQDDSSKNELFIFVTPRVLNEKEAGLRT